MKNGEGWDGVESRHFSPSVSKGFGVLPPYIYECVSSMKPKMGRYGERKSVIKRLII
jgi:hypothetical protein